MVNFNLGVASLESMLTDAGAPKDHLWRPLAPWPAENSLVLE